jgi:hypothetical protein
MYNFTKTRNTRNQECFNHDYFLKGKKFELIHIKKKAKPVGIDQEYER